MARKCVEYVKYGVFIRVKFISCYAIRSHQTKLNQTKRLSIGYGKMVFGNLMVCAILLRLFSLYLSLFISLSHSLFSIVQCDLQISLKIPKSSAAHTIYNVSC